jgi:dipeptidyl aminopeptidase/acylaminoacyl peptidase
MNARGRFLVLVVAGLSGTSACGGGQAAQPPAQPAAPAPTPAKTYSGLGAKSVPPELVAKYAPPPLDPRVAEGIQAMLDIRGTGGGLLTAKGERIIYNWRVTGTTQVWRQDAPMRFPVQLTGGGENTKALALSPDDRFIVISRDRGGEENPGLYLMDIEGGPLTEVHRKSGVQTELGFISDDSRWIYFRANDVDPAAYALYRWDRQTGKRETLLTEPGLWDIVDHLTDKLLLAKELGNTHIEIWSFDLAHKKLTPLLGQNESEEYTARFGARPGTLIVQTNKLGEFHRLYEWQNGDLTPITPEIKHDVAFFRIDEARTKIAYDVNEDGYERPNVVDARTFKPLALPTLPAAEAAYVGGFTRNGRFLSIGYDSATQPGVTISYDWQTRKSTSWRLPSTPEVDVKHFAKATLENFPARDGTKIPMFVWRPAGCAEPCPVVVDFHGGPESQSTAGFNPYAQLFVDAGFVFVQPNIRGSSGYGKTWLHSDDGPRRLQVITDVEDCAKFIKKEWAKNGTAPKVGVSGGSYGGYATLMAMTYFAGAYDAGVDEVGIGNLVTFLQNTSPYRRILRTSEYGDPDKDLDALVKLSPVTYIDRVKAPLLIIQGLNDPRVPVGEALGMHDALAARSLDAPLIIFADEGHGAGKRSNQVLSIGHTIAFFQKHLK